VHASHVCGSSLAITRKTEAMVVPGYVAQVHTEFTRTGELLVPCHEYCGLGHSEMWADVQVLSAAEFKPDRDGRVTCAQH
jgi:cytochrome c oxidase subunit 2